jgi:hypothetical protein
VAKSIQKKATASAQLDHLKTPPAFVWLVLSNVKNAIPVPTVLFAEVIASVLHAPVPWAISMMELQNSAKGATQDVIPAQETQTLALLALMPID